MSLRTVTILGADRHPGQRMPALEQLLKPTLVVQDDVPPPHAIRGQRSETRKVLDALQPGQSVLIPAALHNRDTVRMMIQAMKKLYAGHRYTSKTEGLGVRVWRLE